MRDFILLSEELVWGRENLKVYLDKEDFNQRVHRKERDSIASGRKEHTQRKATQCIIALGGDPTFTISVPSWDFSALSSDLDFGFI